MSYKYDITPGVASAYESEPRSNCWKVEVDGETVCDLYFVREETHDHIPYQEYNADSNAVFIAEAFNVTNETGKTPRELSDEIAERKAQFISHKAKSDTIIHDYKLENERLKQERDEALGALFDVQCALGDISQISVEHILEEVERIIGKAIAKIEGGGDE